MKSNHKIYKTELSKANNIIEVISCIALLISAFVIAWKEYEE